MRRVEVQFKPHWRPSRILWAALAALASWVVLAIGAVAWEHKRILDLQEQVARLVAGERNNGPLPVPRLTPMYDASAREFLHERAAGWAPMLRTLESGLMIGVTASSVEFNAIDGSARVELNYTDSAALIEYLGSINEGVSPGHDLARWTIVETRVAPETNLQNRSLNAIARVGHAVATIRSIWSE